MKELDNHETNTDSKTRRSFDASLLAAGYGERSASSMEVVIRALFLLLALLISGVVMAAGGPIAQSVNPHMRCSAINDILNSAPKARDVLPRQNFKLYMELHAKLAWVSYGDDYQKYKSDYASVLKSLQAELNTKSLSGEAFADEVGNCISLQRHTMDVFMACLHGSEATEVNKQVCARKAVGL